MTAKARKSQLTFYCRICTVIIPTATVGLGLHSHFKSAWVEQSLYRKCEEPQDVACPNIVMERHLVILVISCLVTSLYGFVASFFVNMHLAVIHTIDIGYHVVATTLLIIAGVLYIESAQEIYIVFNKNESELDFNLRRKEKITAGAFTIVQGLIYGITANAIARNP